MHFQGKVFRSVFLAIFVFLLSGRAGAQYTTGAVQGTVLDPSGGAIREATLTLHSRDTNTVRTFTTGAEGIYVFAALPPGYYELTVEA